MKSRFLAKLALSALLVGMSSPAWSNGAGNGGDGILINGKPYLYDLVEAGVHLEPVFNHDVEPMTVIQTKINTIFNHRNDLDKYKLAQKLTEIYQVDKVFALSLLKTMEMYSWRWIDRDLYDVPDDGDTVVKFDKAQMVQLAVRYNKSITINSKMYSQLNSGNAVALIFHEAIYALIRPYEIKSQNNKKESFWEQNANLTRQITGFLFTGELIKGRSALESIVGGTLPSESGFYTNFLNELLNNIRNEFYTYYSGGFSQYVDKAPLQELIKNQNIQFHSYGYFEKGLGAVLLATNVASGRNGFWGDRYNDPKDPRFISYSEPNFNMSDFVSKICMDIKELEYSQSSLFFLKIYITLHLEFDKYPAKNNEAITYVHYSYESSVKNVDLRLGALSKRKLQDMCHKNELTEPFKKQYEDIKNDFEWIDFTSKIFSNTVS